MTDPPTLESDLELYAEIVTDLWSSGRTREEILAARGLGEEEFERVEDRVQDALSAATNIDGDEPPPFVVAYDAALARARDRRLEKVSAMSLETYAKATAALERGGDPRKLLGALQLTVEEYIRGNAFWAPKLAKDAALYERFVAAKRARSR